MKTIQVNGDGYEVHVTYDPERGLPLWMMQVALEKEIIGQTLDVFKGNKAKTADHLQLNRTTLVEKAKKYGFPTRVKPDYTEDSCA